LTGTLINIGAILVGGLLGLFLSGRLPERLRQTVMAGLGLFTLAFGLKMFLSTNNALVVLGSLLIGGILGEWWQIEKGLQNIGVRLETWILKSSSASSDSRFVRGFLTASLLFCVGPMAILGSIQDGLTGDFQTLAVKAIMDGFASLAFASTLGVGVLFSSVVVLFYQGGISMLALQAQRFFSEGMMTEMTATGGVILMAIAFSSLLEIKKIRAGNFLPALLIAVLAVYLLEMFGLYK
jgi:uncharacterized membrane protein YqgA involved in biofilm formation